MSKTISVLIVHHDDAPDPGMPSHFCMGAGVDGALFRVLGPHMPTEQELFGALVSWCDCASLTRYDPQTGVGVFQLIDDYAPEAGQVIELLANDSQPEKTVIIIERGQEANHEC